MQIDRHIAAADGTPAWTTPKLGRRALEEHIEDFMGSALAAAEGVAPPALALRVSAGLGKTGTTLRSLARHGADFLARGHVLVYMPTLELAERASSELRALAPQLPCRVMRGRHADRPGGGGPMCRRSDIVKRIERLVPSVTRAMCQNRDSVAACSAGCAYLAQFEEPEAQILFLAHSYLTSAPPIAPEAPVSLRIIDEQAWTSLIRELRITVDRFMRTPASELTSARAQDHLRARAAILAGLQKGALSQTLLDAGVEAEMLRNLAKAERRSRSKIDLAPDLPNDILLWRVNTFDAAEWFASKARECIFGLLAGESSRAGGRISLGSEPSGAGRSDVIRMHRLAPCPDDAALLMLDADADEEIVRRIAPRARFIRIDVPPRAEVVQVVDRTVSTTWLLDGAQARRRRDDIARIIAREVKRADGDVLLVAAKSVLAALRSDAGQPLDDSERHARLHGAVARWFGPSTRGVNDYESFETVILVGRLQPPVDAVERQARSLFGDDESPLGLLEGAALPEARAWRLMSDGSVVEAAVRTHPDARVASVLRQTREAASTQAIARLRLLSPSGRKRVVIIGSLPLPDLPVTRLVTFDALTHGLETEPDVPGYKRMEAALTSSGSAVLGFRLSAAGLAEDLPTLGTIASAKRFRRSRSTAEVRQLVARVAAAHGWPLAQMDLLLKGGGKVVPAVVFADEERAAEVARRIWPDLGAGLSSVAGG